MTRQQAIELIRSSGGRIFGVRFTKRSTGEVRTMNARLGVTKHLRSGGASYDAADKGLIPVFDMHKGGYRSIPVEGITHLSQRSVWVAIIN